MSPLASGNEVTNTPVSEEEEPCEFNATPPCRMPRSVEPSCSASFCYSALIVAPAVAAPAGTFPSEIPLPLGFQPEGIAVGQGTDFFAGSLSNGAIYKGDLRTGAGDVLVEGTAGDVAVGLGYDERTNYLYVAGGPTGMAWIYDAGTGAEIAEITLTDPGTFVNDVVVTRDAAFFTDSFRPYLYRVELDKGGEVPANPEVTEIALAGEFVFTAGQFNANGIEATQNGKWLIVVNSFSGTLYRVNPATGEATTIDLGGETLVNGDGILLQGKTLYVVQNENNQIAVIRLSNDWLSGAIKSTITNSAFDVPTTVAMFGSSLYAVNARFGTEPAAETEYSIVRVPRR